MPVFLARSGFKEPLTNSHLRFLFSVWILFFIFALSETSHAQDRLKTLPGYEHFQKMSRLMTNAVKSGSLSVTWKDDGKAFEYQKDGKRYRYDIAAKKAVEVAKAPGETARQERTGRRGGRKDGPERGRQFTSAVSPDGKFE